MIGKKSLVILLAAGVVLGGVSVARAQMPKPARGSFENVNEKMKERMQELTKDLNLTPEQEKQLNASHEKNREQARMIFEGMREKSKLLQTELEKDNLDMAKIHQINNELKALQGQMLDQRLSGVLELRKILKPEQFKQFMSRMDADKEHMRPHFPGEKSRAGQVK